MGNGAAFNVHVILYGPQSANYASWNNGLIPEKGSLEVVATHGPALKKELGCCRVDKSGTVFGYLLPIQVAFNRALPGGTENS
jgi:hypothetical protein